MTSRYRCACGSTKLASDAQCFTCSAWTRRQEAGSAPEHKRRAEVSAQSADSGQLGKTLASARSRHPAGKPTLGPSDFCWLHSYKDRYSCERCIHLGEMAWEERDDSWV
jgi:hypothetical protein